MKVTTHTGPGHTRRTASGRVCNRTKVTLSGSRVPRSVPPPSKVKIESALSPSAISVSTTSGLDEIAARSARGLASKVIVWLTSVA